MHTVHEWLQSCRWPDCDADNPGPVALGLSWSEVAVAATLQHGQWPPVKREQPDGSYVVVQHLDQADALRLGTTLQELAAMAAQVVAQYQALVRLHQNWFGVRFGPAGIWL